MRQDAEAIFFPSPAAFRAWLEAHADRAEELLVGFHKVATGRPSLSWSASVDEALCFGWIDGVRRSLGPEAYQIRFTPRRPGSSWSAVNLAKAEALIAEGRMRPAGLAAYANRTGATSGPYSYERSEEPRLAPKEAQAFQRRRRAWAYFESVPPSYRRTVLHWVLSAVQSATRARRLAKLVEACARGERLFR